MQFAVYGTILLLIRLLFHFSPRPKRFVLYCLKAVVEIGIFLLVFTAPVSILAAVSGLLVLLCGLSYALEVRLSADAAGTRKLQGMAPLAGLILYAGVFGLIFASGTVDGFRTEVLARVSGIPLLHKLKPYLFVIVGIIVTAEGEHASRYFRLKFDSSGGGPQNGVHQVAGYAERVAVFALVLFSQFVAAGIVIAGRVVSAALLREGGGTHAAITMFSLSLALLGALALRLVVN